MPVLSIGPKFAETKRWQLCRYLLHLSAKWSAEYSIDSRISLSFLNSPKTARSTNGRHQLSWRVTQRVVWDSLIEFGGCRTVELRVEHSHRSNSCSCRCWFKKMRNCEMEICWKSSRNFVISWSTPMEVKSRIMERFGKRWRRSWSELYRLPSLLFSLLTMSDLALPSF